MFIFQRTAIVEEIIVGIIIDNKLNLCLIRIIYAERTIKNSLHSQNIKINNL